MQNRNRISRQNASDDDCFSKSARPALAEWQQEPFEECAGLEQGLPQGLEEVKVQPLVRVDVIPDTGKKNLKSNKLDNSKTFPRFKPTKKPFL